MHVTKKGGVEAITHYEVLTESKRVSLLKLTLHTGKKIKFVYIVLTKVFLLLETKSMAVK